MKKMFSVIALAALVILFSARGAHATPMKDADVDFSGLVQFIYSWDEAGGDDQLDVQRLRINLTAKPAEKITVNASYEVGANTSGISPTWPFWKAAGARNVQNDGTADGQIVDLYADFNYLEHVTLRVGQFPLPNSYELNTREYDLETIQYSQGVGTFGKRDRGGAIFADPTKELSLTGWIVNGDGAITGTSKDDDDRTGVGLQLDYLPIDFFSMKIWGDWDEQASATTSASDMKEDSFGLGFDYAIHGFHLFSEYNDMNKKTGGVKTSDITEWYIHASYRIPSTDLQVVSRFDNYRERNAGVVLIDQDITTVGMNWDFEKNARLQIMRDFVEGPKNDKLDMQLAIRF